MLLEGNRGDPENTTWSRWHSVEPDQDDGKMDNAEEVARCFLVTRGDVARLFEAIDAPFDDVTATVVLAESRSLNRSAAERGNHRSTGPRRD
jgi:hypothetical protein